VKLAERVGFEATHPLRQAFEGNASCESGEGKSSSGASLNYGQLGAELAEFVRAWPKLSIEIRSALLVLLRSAQGGGPP